MPGTEAAQRPTGFFYGWIIVAAAMSAYVVVSGSTFALSVFIKPMAEGLGCSRADVTTGLAIVLIAGSSLGVVTGYLADRFGPKLIVFAGGVAFTAGFSLASRANQLWQFYASYGLFAGIGMGCMFAPLSSTITRWFIHKRGLALGLFYAGGGVGGLILTPTVQAVISSWDWRAGWMTLAVVSAALILPTALFLVKDPGDMGLLPLGGSEDGAAESTRAAWPVAALVGTGRTEGHSFAEAMRSRKLWLFALGCFLTFSGILMAQINLVAYATDRGIPAATAATAMGLIAGVNAAGRLGMGAVADTLGIRLSMALTALLLAVALFSLNAVDRAWMLFAFAAPFGFLAGGVLTMMPLCLAQLFGTRALGSIMGVTGLFAAIGPALSPVLGAAIYDRSGSYFYAFVLAGSCAVTAFAVFAAILPRSGLSERPLQRIAD